MNIHQRRTRIVISVAVFFMLLVLIKPHLMDGDPPVFVSVLLTPAKWFGRLIGLLRGPCNNMGTIEHPACEGTPLDLLIGLGLVVWSLVLYSLMTYLLLVLISKFSRANDIKPAKLEGYRDDLSNR